MKRQCGDCQLCCKLLPVNAVNKLGGHKCQYQKHGVGCAVYDKLEKVSPECRLWSCGWLVNAAGQLQRPDRSHIVIDIMPDYISIPDPDTGKMHNLGQRTGACAVIRFSPNDGFVLFPPSLTKGDWHEVWTPPTERTHTAAEVIDALGVRSA